MDALQAWLDTSSRFDDCRSSAELHEETSHLVHTLGFDCFAHGHRHAVPFSQTRMRFSGTYPYEWMAHSNENVLPVPGLQVWSETDATPGNLHAFGYASGVTCGARGHDGSWQLLCVARQRGPIRPGELPPLKLYLRALLALLDEHLQRIEGRPPQITLSERETQILRCIADGQRSKDIADLLQLSEHTVLFHTKNLLRKFDAPNRVLAAAHAAAVGLI